MDKKRLLYGSLAIGVGLAITHLSRAKTSSKKETPSSDRYAGIDVYVEKQRNRLHIPGVALAIIEGSQIVHIKGFGQARPGGETPTIQTPFFIGSLTKSFTATAVMQLLEAGKVELDAPVQRYLPWFRLADAEASAQITVRHLLNQTSSLPVMASQRVLAELDDRPGATERQVRALSTLKLSNPVGSKVEYCNLNYNILGLIVEATSGESYAEYIQNHIFYPLRMRHSYCSKAVARQNGLAMGHRHWFSIPIPAPNLPVPIGSLPSGQLISCAEDMSHYLIAHLNAGRYEDAQILSESGIELLHHGAMDYIVWGSSVGKYGMGWFEIDLGQTKTYSHGGNVPDFSAYMALVPEQKKAMVLMLNADPYGLPMITEEVGMGVTALLAGQQPAPIKLDFIQWVMRLLPLLPLFQLVAALATLRRLQRWERYPALRPSTNHLWIQHILLPLIPSFSLSGLLIYLQSSGLTRFLNLFMPDLALIAKISGGFALVWSTLRTKMMLQTLRKPLP